MAKLFPKNLFSMSFIFFVSLSFMVFADLRPAASDDIEDGLFYYSDGKKIPLTMSLDYIALRLKPSGGFHPSKSFPSMIAAKEQMNLSQHGLVLFRLKANKTRVEVMDLQTELRGSRDVELTALVCNTPGASMIVTDEFIAQFTPDFSENEIHALNTAEGVEIIKKVAWAKNTYILRVIGGNALDTANIYHELKDTIYAHPDFVRVMKNAPISPGMLNRRVIIGPAGEYLPSDTPIEKGSNTYRVIEPVSLELPGPLSSGGIGPLVPVSKTIIKAEGFEGAFPNTWALNGAPTWDDENYRAYTGSWSGYCVGSTVTPPGPYPDNANAWMVCGPFDLTDAQDARVDLQAWVNTESGYDYFRIMASTNGTNFHGTSFSGNWAAHNGGNGWMNIMFDLKRVYTLGNVCGESDVWILIHFSSNSSTTYEGVYIDDIVIEKITGGYESLTDDDYDHLQWSLSNNGQLWGTSGADIQAPAAWGAASGNGITVAIIDEGVDLTHPDLNLVAGYDATGGGSGGGPVGNDAHGTNCAGITAAVTNNSQGVAGIAGSARIMPVRIAYGNGSGGWVTSESWIADGIYWAWNNGADVLSNSWGGGWPSTTITGAIDNAKNNGRNGKGAVVVFASGNNNGAVSYPATLSQVLAVGALSPCDERKAPTSCDGEYWWGSNYGSQLDIAAPGVHMYSTDIMGTSGYDSGDYFYNFNGTSSACPVVAGVAALVLSVNPGLTALQVENVLKDSADDLGTAGWDEYTGYGRANAYNAVSNTPGGATIVPMLKLLLLN